MYDKLMQYFTDFFKAVNCRHLKFCIPPIKYPAPASTPKYNLGTAVYLVFHSAASNLPG